MKITCSVNFCYILEMNQQNCSLPFYHLIFISKDKHETITHHLRSILFKFVSNSNNEKNLSV